jgi:hypothetical protein
MAWFVDAMEALGDAAIEYLDPALPIVKRVDALLARLDAIPDHEGLHLALAEACQQAERETAAQTAPPSKPTGAARQPGGKRRAASSADS